VRSFYPKIKINEAIILPVILYGCETRPSVYMININGGCYKTKFWR